MQKNNILLPLDGSAFSLQILPLVQRFLKPTENRLILLHIEPEPETLHLHRLGLEDIDVFLDQAEESVSINFSDQLMPVVRELEAAGFEVTTEVHFGKPAPTIESYIARQAVDMVAMATHGRTGLERLVAGSVAEHLLHHGSAPALLLHSVADAKLATLPLLQ